MINRNNKTKFLMIMRKSQYAVRVPDRPRGQTEMEQVFYCLFLLGYFQAQMRYITRNNSMQVLCRLLSQTEGT